ncbi:hypothetical protein TNCV_2211711 [Trichonephila clavipes]|nr:hypothetical protein TNCV_2211711 [Trichonephila clavipes]
MLPNDIVRCNEHSARKLHADIQSPRANLLSCRIASTIAGRRSQVHSNLFYGSDEQIEQRCHYNTGTRREIVGALQGLFDQHNELVRLV